MDTQAKLGNALMTGLAQLRGQDGKFSMADVGALFEQVSATFHPSDNGTDRALRDEIAQLAGFIAQAKKDIFSGNGKSATGDAALHLDAVIKGTEEASHAIMDAVDAIQAAAASAGGECRQTISDAATKIYEACNFQDLTGQRVRKVIKILNEIDTRIDHMLKLFGAATPESGAPAAKAEPIHDDAQLLNGPQLPGQAPNQAEIDALFGTP